MSYFNVRVYGLAINEANEILLSDEFEVGRYFTKFPGGGLELGEGLIDGLKREFLEECDMEIEVLSHFYTTDFFEKSSFNDSQVISIYYLVRPIGELKFAVKTKPFDFDEGLSQSFRWKEISSLDDEELAFKTDKTVLALLKKQPNDRGN
jgi:8-oxo-dGTP diphosphatase